jgi:DNA primase
MIETSAYSSKLGTLLRELGYRPQGNNQFRGRCPFRQNHDKVFNGSGAGEDSLFITPNKNVYHCFSCKAAGRVSSLLSQEFKVPLFEALRLITEGSIDSFIIGTSAYKSRAVKLSNPTPDDLAPITLGLPSFFTSRGFTAETLNHFKVGRAVIRREETALIPYFAVGSHVATLHRQQTAAGRDMWITPTLFSKDVYLYNYDNADYDKPLLVLEGETDVWRSYQNGYENAVAILGSNVTLQKVEMLAKFPKVILALDPDIVGVMAAEKLYRMLIRRGVSVSFLVLPEGVSDVGDATDAAEFLDCLANPCSYLEFSVRASNAFGAAYETKKATLIKSLKR